MTALAATQAKRKYDVISLGRAAVDVYATELGTRLEDANSFSKYLGGSSGNIAYGCARQGLRVSMFTRVGDDHMGRFVIETFARAGVDTSQISCDKNRLTGLVFLSVKTKTSLPLLFYRKDCADMGITAADVEESYIASTRILIITGTHFSQPGPRAACFQAMEYARKHNVRVVLDLDYRPVLWGLTTLDAGAESFVASEKVSASLQEIFSYCSVIVGTQEEIHIGGGHTDTQKALSSIRAHTEAVIVMKKGGVGAQVFTAAIPAKLSDVPLHKGFPVTVLSTVGAGDAFMSGLMRGYATTLPWQSSIRYANACGALVVSRHGCAPAIPSKTELDTALKHAAGGGMLDQTPALARLHSTSTRTQNWQQLAVLAFDHRLPFEELAAELKIPQAVIAPRLSELKNLLLSAFYETTTKLKLHGKAGILCDDIYGLDVLNDITGKNFFIARPAEAARRRPINFIAENMGLTMTAWPQSHVVKCLFFLAAEDKPAMLQTQLTQLRRLADDCAATQHELMLEWLPYLPNKKTPASIAVIMEKIYTAGIFPAWWKLLIETQEEWDHATAAIAQYDASCRGILLLGAAKDMQDMQKLFRLGSTQTMARGFAVGRTIFKAPATAWLKNELSAAAFVQAVVKNYTALIQAWGKFT